MKETKLVAFDLFGTLVKFGKMHHPYRKILKWAKENGRKPRQDDARMIMTIDADPEMVFSEIGIFPPSGFFAKFHQEIQEELKDLSLFEDVHPVFEALENRGIKIAVCSNLAKPYGAVIEKLLSKYKLINCLSYEVGAIKPEFEIYEDIVGKSRVMPNNILFVGDTFLADVDGPSNFGFRALHLKRDETTNLLSIQTLTDLIQK